MSSYPKRPDTFSQSYHNPPDNEAWKSPWTRCGIVPEDSHATKMEKMRVGIAELRIQLASKEEELCEAHAARQFAAQEVIQLREEVARQAKILEQECKVLDQQDRILRHIITTLNAEGWNIGLQLTVSPTSDHGNSALLAFCEIGHKDHLPLHEDLVDLSSPKLSSWPENLYSEGDKDLIDLSSPKLSSGPQNLSSEEETWPETCKLSESRFTSDAQELDTATIRAEISPKEEQKNPGSESEHSVGYIITEPSKYKTLDDIIGDHSTSMEEPVLGMTCGLSEADNVPDNESIEGSGDESMDGETEKPMSKKKKRRRKRRKVPKLESSPVVDAH